MQEQFYSYLMQLLTFAFLTLPTVHCCQHRTVI